MAALRAYIVIALVALLTAVLLPVQALLVRRGGRAAEQVPMLYHRGICRLLRLTVETRGRPETARPVLFVCNHVSWLDIPVLGGVLPACFIAKQEVAGWPLFGLLAKLQRTVFIERRARRTAEHRDSMNGLLEQGENLILFPEGTSGDGLHVLPFKSAFFSLAERRPGGRPLCVQPVSLVFARLDNLPVGRRTMPIYAWVGDQDLVPHLWRFLRAGPATVVLVFHAPVTVQQFASRKDLAEYCREAVRSGVDGVLSGCRPEAPARPATLPAAAAARSLP